MKIVYSADCLKQISKLDKQIQKRILDYMDEVSELKNPRSRGKILLHDLKGLWRYRVGDYRILCRIVDDELVIVALEIGHRREVYSK